MCHVCYVYQVLQHPSLSSLLLSLEYTSFANFSCSRGRPRDPDCCSLTILFLHMHACERQSLTLILPSDANGRICLFLSSMPRFCLCTLCFCGAPASRRAFSWYQRSWVSRLSFLGTHHEKPPVATFGCPGPDILASAENGVARLTSVACPGYS